MLAIFKGFLYVLKRLDGYVEAHGAPIAYVINVLDLAIAANTRPNVSVHERWTNVLVACGVKKSKWLKAVSEADWDAMVDKLKGEEITAEAFMPALEIDDGDGDGDGEDDDGGEGGAGGEGDDGEGDVEADGANVDIK